MLLSRVTSVKLSTAESFLAGYTIWSFSVLVPIYFFLILNFDVRQFFIVANVASVVLSFGVFIFLHRKVSIGNSVYSMAFITLLLISSVSLIQLFTPIIFNWDAVSIYIPLASEINSTGLCQGIYHGTNYASATLPFLPSFYAWLINLSGGIYLRLVPAFFLILNAIVFSCISKRLKIEEKIGTYFGLISFLMAPSVAVLAGFEGLYGDLPFMFFLSVSVLFIGLYLTSKSLFYLIMAGAAVCLSASCKEYGLFFIPIIGSLIFLKSHLRHYKCSLVVLTSFSPFFLLMFWDFWFGAKPYDVMIFRAIALFCFSFILFSILKRIQNHIVLIPSLHIMKHVLCFSIFLLPIGAFLLKNIINMGVITLAWAPRVSQFYESINYPLISSEIILPVSYFRIDALYTSITLGFVTLPLILIGLFYVLKQKRVNISRFVAIFILICLVAFFSFIFHFNFQGTEFRRLSIFMPYISLFAAIGLTFIIKQFEFLKEIISSYYFSILSLLFSLYWFFYLPNSSIQNKSIPEAPFSFYLLSLFIIFLPLIINRLKINFDRLYWFKNKLVPLFLVVLLISVCLFSFSITRLYFSIPDKTQEENVWYYDDSRSLWSPWRQLSDYIQRNTTLNSKIISFGALPLIYYTNRTFIDINYVGMLALSDYLNCNSTEELTSNLLHDGIEYFLIPTSNIWNADYHAYNKLAEQYLLFNITKSGCDDIQAVLLLNEYVLYKIVPSERVSLSFLSNNSKWFSEWSNAKTITVMDDFVSASGISNKDGYFDLTLHIPDPISLKNMAGIIYDLSFVNQHNTTVELFVYDNQDGWGSATVFFGAGSFTGNLKSSLASFFTTKDFDWENISTVRFSLKSQPFSNSTLSLNSTSLIIPVHR